MGRTGHRKPLFEKDSTREMVIEFKRWGVWERYGIPGSWAPTPNPPTSASLVQPPFEWRGLVPLLPANLWEHLVGQAGVHGQHVAWMKEMIHTLRRARDPTQGVL